MRDIFAENLYDAHIYNQITSEVAGKEKTSRRDIILKINEINPYLAALCLKKIRGAFKKELQASVKQQALLQIKTLTERDVVTRAVLALYELREYDSIASVLVKNPEKNISRFIIQDIFTDNTKEDHSKLVFRFLNILFENLPKDKLTKSPMYGLWEIALESLPDSLLVSEHHADLEKFYRFFVSKNNYFSSLHLLPEKISGLFEKFKEILGESNKYFSFRLKNIYLNLIKRNPIKLWDYLDEIKHENVGLDTIFYNRLIHYTKDVQTAEILFEEMKQQ
ncbi:MAG: hypothetical protein KAH84_00280, partial [Thiomargarita sp.]|nr:hypothetical protein [Thiomargarita sp.]